MQEASLRCRVYLFHPPDINNASFVDFPMCMESRETVPWPGEGTVRDLRTQRPWNDLLNSYEAISLISLWACGHVLICRPCPG